jgi:hypothetical protein
MARRSREREAAAAHSFDRSTGGEQRRAVARLGADGVGVEPASPVPDAVDVRGRVAAQDVAFPRRRAADEREAFVEHLDARLRLRMRAGRVQRGEA